MTILFPRAFTSQTQKSPCRFRDISDDFFVRFHALSGISDKDADCVVPSVGQGDDADVIDPAGDAVYDG